MHLLLFPLLPLLLVPLFVICAAVFAVGAMLRLLFVIALVFAVGFLLFGQSLFRGLFRLWKFRSHAQPSLRSRRRFDAQPSHDFDSSAFEDYRRATMRRSSKTKRESFVLFSRSSESGGCGRFSDFPKVAACGRSAEFVINCAFDARGFGVSPHHTAYLVFPFSAIRLPLF